MARLNENERTLLVLRFFENKNAAEAAALMGIREWAAHKRAARAVEKLRRFFARRGVAVTAGVLTGALAVNAIQAAPDFLARTATALALTKGAAAGGTTLTLIQEALKIMAWTKLKTGVVGAVVAASLIVPLVVGFQARAKLRESDEQLRRQAEQLAQLEADHDRLARQAADGSPAKSQLDDLQRLQAEAQALRQEAEAKTRWRETNPRQARAATDEPKTALQLKEDAMARMGYGRSWMVGFYQYAEKHQGQFPASFAEAAAYVPDSAWNRSDLTPDEFEIVFRGSPASLQKPNDVIVLRQKEAWNAGASSHPPGQWAKVYAFADGHSEVHLEPENNFDAYEQQHMVMPSANTP